MQKKFDKAKKKFFNIGLFLQIDWKNPVYLDKTGKLIHELEENNLSWKGGINGFKFQENSVPYKGEVSISKLWFSGQSLGDENNVDFLNYFEKFKNIYEKALVVYSPTKVNNFGIRNQLIYKEKIPTLKKALDDSLKINIKNPEGFEIEYPTHRFVLKREKMQIIFNISCVAKQNVNTPGPETGLLLDLDFKWQNFIENNIEINRETFDNFLEFRNTALEWFFDKTGLING